MEEGAAGGQPDHGLHQEERRQRRPKLSDSQRSEKLLALKRKKGGQKGSVKTNLGLLKQAVKDNDENSAQLYFAAMKTFFCDFDSSHQEYYKLLGDDTESLQLGIEARTVWQEAASMLEEARREMESLQIKDSVPVKSPITEHENVEYRSQDNYDYLGENPEITPNDSSSNVSVKATSISSTIIQRQMDAKQRTARARVFVEQNKKKRAIEEQSIRAMQKELAQLRLQEVDDETELKLAQAEEQAIMETLTQYSGVSSRSRSRSRASVVKSDRADSVSQHGGSNIKKPVKRHVVPSAWESPKLSVHTPLQPRKLEFNPESVTMDLQNDDFSSKYLSASQKPVADNQFKSSLDFQSSDPAILVQGPAVSTAQMNVNPVQLQNTQRTDRNDVQHGVDTQASHISTVQCSEDPHSLHDVQHNINAMSTQSAAVQQGDSKVASSGQTVQHQFNTPSSCSEAVQYNSTIPLRRDDRQHSAVQREAVQTTQSLHPDHKHSAHQREAVHSTQPPHNYDVQHSADQREAVHSTQPPHHDDAQHRADQREAVHQAETVTIQSQGVHYGAGQPGREPGQSFVQASTVKTSVHPENVHNPVQSSVQASTVKTSVHPEIVNNPVHSSIQTSTVKMSVHPEIVINPVHSSVQPSTVKTSKHPEHVDNAVHSADSLGINPTQGDQSQDQSDVIQEGSVISEKTAHTRFVKEYFKNTPQPGGGLPGVDCVSSQCTSSEVRSAPPPSYVNTSLNPTMPYTATSTSVLPDCLPPGTHTNIPPPIPTPAHVTTAPAAPAHVTMAPSAPAHVTATPTASTHFTSAVPS